MWINAYVALGALAVLGVNPALVPLASAQEQVVTAGGAPAEASDQDSNAAKWSHINKSRYVDVIRKTDRVTYPDGGVFATPACDVTGDNKADLIFYGSGTLSVVDRIPFGSESDEVSLSIAHQPGVQRFQVGLPGGAGSVDSATAAAAPTPLVACVPAAAGGASWVAVAAGNTLALVQPQAHRMFARVQLPEAVTALVGYLEGAQPRLAVAYGSTIDYLDLAKLEQLSGAGIPTHPDNQDLLDPVAEPQSLVGAESDTAQPADGQESTLSGSSAGEKTSPGGEENQSGEEGQKAHGAQAGADPAGGATAGEHGPVGGTGLSAAAPAEAEAAAAREARSIDDDILDDLFGDGDTGDAGKQDDADSADQGAPKPEPTAPAQPTDSAQPSPAPSLLIEAQELSLGALRLPSAVRALVESHAEAPTLVAGVPDKATVFEFAPGTTSLAKARKIEVTKGAANSEFGASLAVTKALDGIGGAGYGLAIGAPGAFNGAGAVALVPGAGGGAGKQTGDLRVDLESVSGTLVTDKDGTAAGHVLRQNLHGRFGSSVAWIDGANQPGALLVGRPINEEHPGGLVISETALNKDWVAGRGIDEIPGSQWAWLASDEDTKIDGGARVGVVPPRGTDKLTGVFTADSHGKVDVWTVDMSRQGDDYPETPVEPTTPAPPAPSADPGLTPVNEPGKRSWLGEFTSGFGGALGRGECDVTGDGVPDIVSGNVVRSEWKFDPYYAETTKTKGWIPNVTGQVQVIPGQNPGGTLPQDGVITINGPVKTQDPALDANLGFSVACAGDVNGDGISDIVAGSVTMGRIWVLYGGESLGSVDLNNLDPTHGIEIRLPVDGAPGFNISSVGDVDGDGLADIGFVVANARYAMKHVGETSGTALVVKGGARSGPVDLTDLDAESPEVIYRIDQPEGHTMNSFTRVGDVNGDGVRDFVVTDFQAFDKANHVAGQAWVVYGEKAGAKPGVRVHLAESFAGYTLAAKSDKSMRLGSGTSVADLGDLDGDGTDEFVIGFDGGQIMNTGPGGVAVVYGTRDGERGGERAEKRGFFAKLFGRAQPPQRVVATDGKDLDPNIRVVTGPADTAFGYAVDAHKKDEKLPVRVAVGAGTLGSGGAVFIFDPAALPQGATELGKLPQAATRIDSVGQKARFGRSVAFSKDPQGEPMLLAGGDGVIDEEPSEANNWEETKGYAHTAHVLALRMTGDATPAPGQPGKPGEPGKEEPGAPAPGKPEEPGQPGKPGNDAPGDSAPGDTPPGAGQPDPGRRVQKQPWGEVLRPGMPGAPAPWQDEHRSGEPSRPGVPAADARRTPEGEHGTGAAPSGMQPKDSDAESKPGKPGEKPEKRKHRSDKRKENREKNKEKNRGADRSEQTAGAEAADEDEHSTGVWPGVLAVLVLAALAVGTWIVRKRKK